MERKNTMLLTVIAVATLLVAVVGATFAYYSVQGGANSSTTAINTSTGAAATVTYTAGEDQLYLKVTAAQMAQTAQGIYYAQDSNIDASPAATDYVLGTFTVTGAGDSDVHRCTFDWTITTNGNLKQLEDNTTNGRISVTAGTAQTDTGTLSGLPGATVPFKGSAQSGTGTFVATGNQAATIHGTASITNTNAVQSTTGNDISGLSDVVTTFNVTNVVCTAAAS